MRLTEINDEKILYDLNADIIKESRINPNSETSVKQMIRTFKQQNPELIARVQSKRCGDNIETSARSSVTNARGSESTNNVISSKDSAVGVIVGETESSANLVSSKDSRREKLEIPKKRPIIVYSTTDDQNEEDCMVNQSTNCTTVRSSNELLNTVLGNEDNYSEHELREDSYKTREKQTETKKKTLTEAAHSFASDVDVPNAYENSEHSIHNSLASPNCHAQNSNVRDTDETSEMETDMTDGDNKAIDLDEDSELAEALTQVLEEYSQEDENVQSETDDSLIEEELARETIAEINESFAIDTIILTPPFDFRD